VLVPVEGSARIVRGLLIPFDRVTVVGDRIDGHLVVMREVFDAQSVDLDDRLIPLLLAHDDAHPIGRVDRLWQSGRGVEMEATLVGSSQELDGVRERAGHGVMSGLSIAFRSDDRRDVWTAPTYEGGLPLVRRRGVRIREASLVTFPAYDVARIDTIRNRTEHQLESDTIIADFRARREKAETQARAQRTARQHELRAIVDQLRRTAPVIPTREAPPAPSPVTVAPLPPVMLEPLVPDLPPEPGPDADEYARYEYQRAVDDWLGHVRDVGRALEWQERRRLEA
jgi:HK97 family phage prohead protease